MKFKQTSKGIYENKEHNIEICKDSAMDMDFPTMGWVMFVDGEWYHEAKTKKECVDVAERMAMWCSKD